MFHSRLEKLLSSLHHQIIIDKPLQALDYKTRIELEMPSVDNKLNKDHWRNLHYSISTYHMQCHNPLEHHRDHRNADVQVQVGKFDHSRIHRIIIIQAPNQSKMTRN